MQKNEKFDCPKCGHSFIATSQEYKTITTPHTNIKEGYCPICGTVIQITSNNFYGSGGGKF